MLDRVADLIPAELSTREIAERLGKTPAQINAYIQRIRRGLGEQAR